MKRSFLTFLIAVLTSGPTVASAVAAPSTSGHPVKAAMPRNPSYTRVVTPNGSTLPWEMENGVKAFHLTVETCRHEIAPGMVINAWCYNGQTPGPTIEAVEGDRVRIYATNKLPEPTAVPRPRLLLPHGLDGVPGLSHKAIPARGNSRRPGSPPGYPFPAPRQGAPPRRGGLPDPPPSGPTHPCSSSRDNHGPPSFSRRAESAGPTVPAVIIR